MTQETPQIVKIKGKFLPPIEERGDYLALKYISQHGEPREKVMLRGGMEQFIPMAQGKIVNLARQRLYASDIKQIEKLEDDMEYERIQILWPTMFAAWSNGEDLSFFFDGSGIQAQEVEQAGQTDNKSKSGYRRHIPKYIIVKKGVDDLLAKKRLSDSDYSLEEAKHEYADLTNDTYDNVNKAYYYKPKK